ncbi:ParB family protein [Vibrio campbellii]|uniref:ParB family protein n=1 Tax=Vibrio campbellii TaxID=680 RepID=UPI00210A5DEE|nr:ParB family protein [Vibrio campbellii]UTZ44621.1 hypothetical protein HB764_25515 [Vibrio campbellii]
MNVQKSRFSAKANKFSQEQSNGLTESKAAKVYKLTNGEREAFRMVIKSDDVEVKTEKHPLNYRNQLAFNERSLAKTLADIRDSGIRNDCLGIWADKERSKIHVIKGSRRRWCAIKLGIDYPIWVLPFGCATNDDIRKLIASDELQRPHSYRERGEGMCVQLKERGLEPDSMKNDEIAAELGIGRETVRKCMQAHYVNSRLLELIPDYESVNQPVYAELAKLEKALDKDSTKSISGVVKKVSLALVGVESLETDEAQKKAIEELNKAILGKGKSKGTEWKASDIVKFDSRLKKARKLVSADGRNVKFELNRQDPDLIAKIESLIKEHHKS